MKIAISVPSGAHARTLLLPLKRLLEQDPDIERVICISPGAPYRKQLFPTYGEKFEFTENPDVQADIVVTTTSGLDPNDPAILETAQKNNVPTLTFIESWDNVWKMQRLAQNAKALGGERQVLADHIIVWNTMMRDHLIRIWPELENNRISVIGAPRLDYFFHSDKIPSREELFNQLALAPAGRSLGEGWKDESLPLIHVSTTELYPIDYVVKALQKFPAYLYASVHPGGSLENHKILEKYGAQVRYSFGRQPESPLKDFLYNPTEGELYMLVALFKHSNLLINHSSTTALESMLADVPIINVKYGQPFDFWRWKKSPVFRDFQEHYADLISDGATTVVESRRELIEATQRYLEHPEFDREARAKTLKKMITTVDGTASQKVLDKIKDMAR